jgi:hypothetical protein
MADTGVIDLDIGVVVEKHGPAALAGTRTNPKKLLWQFPLLLRQ